MKHKHSDPFQALADVSRREILHLLSKESRSINSLALNFDMSRPAVSKHIKILYGAGFISIEDKGRERVCALNKTGFKDVQNWISFFDDFWNSRLDALGSLLHGSKTKQHKRAKKRK